MPIAVAAGLAPARLKSVRLSKAHPTDHDARNATTDIPEATESAESADPSASAVAENWELVRAAQHGDSTAFATLYHRHVDSVFRYVLLRVGDRHLAEDVTSETFLRALRRITSISYQGRDVGAWFTTIARNLVLDHVKSSRFRLEVVTDEVTDPVTSGPAIAAAADTQVRPQPGARPRQVEPVPPGGRHRRGVRPRDVGDRHRGCGRNPGSRTADHQQGHGRRTRALHRRPGRGPARMHHPALHPGLLGG